MSYMAEFCSGLSFHRFAASSAVHSTRSISIKKLAHSQEMDEFLWLQRLHQYRDDYDSESAFQQQVAGNW